jgi:capsular exopolysaccharide synthesis family protein
MEPIRMAPPLGGTGFFSSWAKIRIQLLRFLAVLRKRWWVLLLTMTIGVCVASWFISQMPPSFQSQGRMMVSGQIRLPEGAAYSEEAVNFFGTQIELMQSGEVVKRAYARVQALHPELPQEKVKLQVGQLPRASIFLLAATGASEKYPQAFLDALMQEYINIKKEMRSEKSENTTTAIADELVRLEKELQSQEDELLAFQKLNNIGFLHEEGNSAGAYLAKLNQELAELKKEYDLLGLLDIDQNLDREQTDAVNSATEKSAFAEFGPIAEYQKAKQSIEALRAQRDDLGKYLKPKHPDIVALNQQISFQQNLINSFRDQGIETLKNKRESIRVQIENTEGVIKQWEAKALDLSRRIGEYDKIKSKMERTKSQYDRLLTNLRNVDVTRNLDQDIVTILEKASSPVSIKPGWQKVLLQGFLAGALAGIAILLFLDKLDDRIVSFVEFRSQFPEHLMGQIPKETTTGGFLLLAKNDSRHALLESFRTLRSSIIFLPTEGRKAKTLLLTSATPNEGKTTVASNLAITFAFSGAKTLIVDADLRRGELHQTFNVPADEGFSMVLQQRIKWPEAILRTEYENLFILPRGKPLPHPSEHLLGKATDQFLKEVYEQFDYVIFDTAPVLAADDALSLAPKVDGTLVVVRFDKSSARMSRKALELLSHRQVKILGLICNDVKLSESEYGYGYYYQYGDRYKEAQPTA